MSKKYLLFAGKEVDTDVQSVAVNQVVQMEGYSYDKYVVYEVLKTQWGVQYKLINLRTKGVQTTDIIRPLGEKFGIGYYYDEVSPTFLDAFEVAILVQEAQQKQKAEGEEAERESNRVEEVKKIGRERFTSLLPASAQAVIVARLKQDDSDAMTDYFASSTQRTVILGFSTHQRDIFSEMRKHAAHFGETAHLAEYNEAYEHREKHAMGAGYYLGESKFHGWIIEKVPVYDRHRAIEMFAYTAGDAANIRIKQEDTTPPSDSNGTGKENCTLVEYSAKAVAVFGDTKPIKEELLKMGGRFNSRLTLNGEKIAGWIFPKSKEPRLACYFGLD